MGTRAGRASDLEGVSSRTVSQPGTKLTLTGDMLFDDYDDATFSTPHREVGLGAACMPCVAIP